MWECWECRECLNSWGCLPFTNGIQTAEQNPNVGIWGNYLGSSRPMAACCWRMCRSKWAANCAASAHWTGGGTLNSGEFLVGELQMGRFCWAAVIFWSEMLQPCINVGEIWMDNKTVIGNMQSIAAHSWFGWVATLAILTWLHAESSEEASNICACTYCNVGSPRNLTVYRGMVRFTILPRQLFSVRFEGICSAMCGPQNHELVECLWSACCQR